jgi:hypothetical protein
MFWNAVPPPIRPVLNVPPMLTVPRQLATGTTKLVNTVGVVDAGDDSQPVPDTFHISSCSALPDRSSWLVQVDTYDRAPTDGVTPV